MLRARLVQRGRATHDARFTYYVEAETFVFTYENDHYTQQVPIYFFYSLHIQLIIIRNLYKSLSNNLQVPFDGLSYALSRKKYRGLIENMYVHSLLHIIDDPWRLISNHYWQVPAQNGHCLFVKCGHIWEMALGICLVAFLCIMHRLNMPCPMRLGLSTLRQLHFVVNIKNG